MPASGKATVKTFLYQEYNLESALVNGKSSYLSKDGKRTIHNNGGMWFIGNVARRRVICDA